MNIREQLHMEIDLLPNEVVEQIAEFTLFVMSRRQITPLYVDWNQAQWRIFTLDQFFRDDDEVEYSLEDAQTTYHP